VTLLLGRVGRAVDGGVLAIILRRRYVRKSPDTHDLTKR
jgi:hypothetical protein